jgi:uncharacterized membrane protein YdjX (TVP38/TMEM64 family)
MWQPALLVLIVLVAIGVALEVGVPSLEEIRSWVAVAGWGGPVLYAVVYAGLSLTPVPVSVLSIAGGVLFGLGLGLPVVLAGAITGAVAGFGLAPRLGRGSMVRLQERAGPGAVRLSALDGLLRRRGMITMIGVRLAPVLPFAMLNMGCGLTAVRLRDYTIGSAVGMTPGAAALWPSAPTGPSPGRCRSCCRWPASR